MAGVPGYIGEPLAGLVALSPKQGKGSLLGSDLW